MAIDISENLRSDEGKRRGGRTRAIGETAWGMVDPATPQLPLAPWRLRRVRAIRTAWRPLPRVLALRLSRRA
jgi:hypothetical protein